MITFLMFFHFRNVAVVRTPLKILRNVALVQRELLYLFFRFLRFLQNVRVATVALRIRCLQKSIEIVDVCKTNGKPTILHDFRVGFVSDRLRFFLSRLGAFGS